MRLYLAYFNLVACDLVPFDSNFETECKLFTQHLVLDNDCCISRNVRRTKTNLFTSNNLYFTNTFVMKVTRYEQNFSVITVLRDIVFCIFTPIAGNLKYQTK